MDNCLKRYHFIWNKKMYVIENAGHIALSIMVMIAEGYLQFFDEKPISQAIVEDI